jgi:hypothetical protein
MPTPEQDEFMRSVLGVPAQFFSASPPSDSASGSADAAPLHPSISVSDKGNKLYEIKGTGFAAGQTILIETKPVGGAGMGELGDYNVVADANNSFTTIIQIGFEVGEKAAISARTFGAQGSNEVVVTCQATADPNDPATEPQKQDAQRDMGKVAKAYEAALQGASGRSSLAPQQVAEFSRAVAEAALRTEVARHKEAMAAYDAQAGVTPTDDVAGRSVWWQRYDDFFYESIQGTASADNDAEAVVAKSHQMALASLNVMTKEKERIDWMSVDLPHAMVPDCRLEHGKVKGPKNHLLCSTHGHVVDTDKKQVIARSIPDYEAARKSGAL